MAAATPASADCAASFGTAISCGVLIIRRRLTMPDASDQFTCGQAAWKRAASVR